MAGPPPQTVRSHQAAPPVTLSPNQHPDGKPFRGRLRRGNFQFASNCWLSCDGSQVLSPRLPSPAVTIARWVVFLWSKLLTSEVFIFGGLSCRAASWRWGAGFELSVVVNGTRLASACCAGPRKPKDLLSGEEPRSTPVAGQDALGSLPCPGLCPSKLSGAWRVAFRLQAERPPCVPCCPRMS
jgi:hypothetical protein